ncbi:MAG: hypothetical protein JF615_17520 [Asticcacaulis sp.]|nr:hypothetical protein [Asticcacaulis sp.]
MFRSIIIAALAVAGVAAAAPALAEDYVLLDVSDDYSDMTVLDYSSIAVDHDQVKKAWLVTISVGPAIEDNVVRSHTLWLFDCPNSKAAIRTMQLYADVDHAPTDDLTLQDS